MSQEDRRWKEGRPFSDVPVLQSPGAFLLLDVNFIPLLHMLQSSAQILETDQEHTEGPHFSGPSRHGGGW